MIPLQLAFIVAGAAAGLAGALYSFSKGSIDPTMISISMSIDFLMMILTGGIQTGASQPDAARALVKFITSPEAVPVVRKKGMEPGA